MLQAGAGIGDDAVKILVRSLKKVHFDCCRLRDEPICWRQRGSESFAPFEEGEFDGLREQFVAAGREDPLDR